MEMYDEIFIFQYRINFVKKILCKTNPARPPGYCMQAVSTVQCNLLTDYEIVFYLFYKLYLYDEVMHWLRIICVRFPTKMFHVRRTLNGTVNVNCRALIQSFQFFFKILQAVCFNATNWGSKRINSAATFGFWSFSLEKIFFKMH